MELTGLRALGHREDQRSDHSRTVMLATRGSIQSPRRMSTRTVREAIGVCLALKGLGTLPPSGDPIQHLERCLE
jgi:hypothetical protein